MSNSLIITSNAFLYLLTFAIYQYNKKYFGVGSFLLMLYSFVAVMGVLYYESPYETSGTLAINVHVFFYLYLYIMLLIAAYPILVLKEENIVCIQRPSLIAFKLICGLMIAIQVAFLISVLPKLFSAFSFVSQDASYSKELYLDSKVGVESVGRRGINFLGVSSGIFIDIAPFFLMYYLTYEKKNVFFLFGLILSALVGPLTNLAYGLRGGVVRFIFEIIVSFLLFKRFFHFKTSYYVKLMLLLIIIFVFVPLFVYTQGRFTSVDNEDSVYRSITSYLGQSFVNFGSYGLDAGGIRYGDRLLTSMKMVFFYDVPRNTIERVVKYRHMMMDETTFSTFVGDFTLDFGPYATVFIFVVFMFIFRAYLKIKQGRILFHQLILVYLLLFICCGVFLFPLADIGGNIKLVAFILFYFYFKFDYRRKDKVFSNI